MRNKCRGSFYCGKSVNLLAMLNSLRIVPLIIVVLLQLQSAEGNPSIFTEAEAAHQNLFLRDGSVLLPNVKVITVKGSPNGMLTFESWKPSPDELTNTEIDHLDKERNVDGDRSPIKYQNNSQRLDYVDIGVNLTYSKGPQQYNDKATVELLVVCDMEWGAIFNFSRREILNYFIVYFSDVAMRYKTLPSADISFRITGIVVIENRSGQPFIEKARGDDGRASMNRILPLFASWAYKNMDALPKFDVAAAITNTPLEWIGGLAYIRTACMANQDTEMHYGTLVFNDDGSWGSVSAAAHEIGHSLGAPHDEDEDSFPEGCTDRGYVMSGNSDEFKWYFSICSNRKIGDFIRSDNSDCLRRQDESAELPINPDFGSAFGPTMDEQCRRRLKNNTAFIPEHEDRSNCTRFKCAIYDQVHDEYKEYSLDPVDNTICKGDGRCFRGRCRGHSSLVYNVGSGNCIRSLERFSGNGSIQMGNCNRPGTAMDKFSISDSEHGKMLAIPWQTFDAKENGDKCMYIGKDDESRVQLHPCDANDTRFGWDFIDAGNGQFLLSNRATGLCATDTGRFVQGSSSCNGNDPYMRWALQ